MSRAARFFWICAAAAALCLVALSVLSAAELEPAGMRMFDLNVLGYDTVFAVKYLGALEAEGITLYLGVFRLFDTVFPILLALSLAGAIWLNTKGAHPTLRLLLLLAPASYLMMDLAENAAVARILRALPVIAPEPVARASGFTQAKWLSVLITTLLTLWAWRFAPKTRIRRPR